MVADKGWCSGTLLFDIHSGNVEDTDVSGTKVALNVDFPSGYPAGNGTGRLYFDPNTAQEQRSALESVIRGQQGGLFEALSALIPNFLPTKEARITLHASEEATRIGVGDFGVLVVQPLRGPQRDFTRLLHGATALSDDVVLAKGTGSRWQDPEMREWESGGHAEQGDFDWRA